MKANVISDTFKSFSREASEFEKIDYDVLDKLLFDAQNMDIEAQNKIVYSYLDMTCRIAKRFKRHYALLNLDEMDLISEATIGIIKAIWNYDSRNGTFTSYVEKCIEFSMLNAIKEKEKQLHYSDYIMSVFNKYIKYLDECKKLGKPVDDDDTLCIILGIKLGTLLLIKKIAKQKMVSLNTILSDGERELIDVIPSSNDDINYKISEINDRDLLLDIKDILTAFEYYIIYYIYFAEEKLSRISLAKKFYVNEKTIKRFEVKALKKLKPLFSSKALKLKNKSNPNRENLRIEPLNLDYLILFAFLKSRLTFEERKYMYLLVFGEYCTIYNIFLDTLKIDISEADRIVMSVRKILSKTLKSIQFQNFKNQMLKNYKTRIFDIDELRKCDDVAYADVYYRYAHLTYDEIKELYGDDFAKLSNNSISLLQRYFGHMTNKHYDSFGALKEINLMLFGYKKKNTNIDIGKLKEAYLNNKEEFNEEFSLYLECFVFNMQDKKIFLDKYPNSKAPRIRNILIRKLEVLYFGIDSLFEYYLTKEQYMEVLRLCSNQIDAQIKELLNSYYGVNSKKLSVTELSKKYGISSDKMREMIFSYRKHLLSLLCNFDDKIQINYQTYLPYVLDFKYELNEVMRKALRLLFEKNLSYDDIAKTLNAELDDNSKTYTSRDVAGLISKGIAKIDSYRFGIDKPIKFTEEKLTEYFNFRNVDEKVKEIICLKYLSFLSNDEIATISNLEKSKVNRIIGDFNSDYIDFLVKDVQITSSEIEEEINRHPVDSVISEEEKAIISYYYGIKSKYNCDGEKLVGKAINEKIGITGNSSRKCKDILLKIKRRKIGDLVPDLVYINREDLERILEDTHLPISFEDREIICYLLELDGYPFKSCKDIAPIFGINEKGVKRKYQMAIININKYLLNEKEGVISYEEDILPNLKYFTAFERILINDYYCVGMSYSEMAKEHNISVDRIKKAMYRIKVQLSNIISGDISRMFDFDYYEQVVDCDDLPFYGNKDLAKRIFSLYVGENSFDKLSLEEIQKTLKLGLSTNAILNIIKSLLLSVFKYRLGIRKEKTFTFDDAKSYYLKNKSVLTMSEVTMFNKFFSKHNDVVYKMSEDLIFLLLRYKYPNYFDFSRITKDEARVFLNKHANDISKKTKDSMLLIMGLTERDFMTGKEKAHVLRILSILDRSLKNDNNAVRTLEKDFS